MDKRAKKLGYANAEEMREKYKNNEVSPWLLGVYTGNFVPPGKFKNFPKFCPKFISTFFFKFSACCNGDFLHCLCHRKLRI